MRRASIPLVIGLLCSLAFSSVARADIQKSGPEVWPGKSELSAHIGLQQGLTGFSGGGTPSGFKFLADYSYHYKDLVWFNAGINIVLAGGGCGPQGLCGYGAGGDAVEPHAGIKLKWTTPIPLVAYAKLDAAFIGIFNRFCDDNGFALAGVVGGGAKYFLTKNIGVGLETNIGLGPGIYSGTSQTCIDNRYGSHTELYASFDIAAGAEFVF